MPPPYDDVRAAAHRFAIDGELQELVPHERGHIHDTYISTWRDSDGSPQRYLHQRLNEGVFRDIPGLMNNVQRVTRHLTTHAADGDMEVLRLVRTDGGEHWLRDESGAWRTYEYVEGTVSHDDCDGPEQAYDAAHAFGRFQACLSDLPASELTETIPCFFCAPHRLEQLDAAHEADSAGRVAEATPELTFVDDRRPMIGAMEERLADGRLERRIVHGDTKLNNILFDEFDGSTRCVVDLDTCMPGWSLYDFGDLVRFAATTAAEDERDLTRVGMDIEIYRALAVGYLAGTGGFLGAEERALMPLAARLVTITIGMRFLADHLAGDEYFKVHRPGHNLDRARAQFALVASMEAQGDDMAAALR